MEIDATDNRISIIVVALGNVTRINILRFCDDWKSVKEISVHIGISVASTSIHVDKLVAAKLLEVEKYGRRAKIYKRKHETISIRFANANDIRK